MNEVRTVQRLIDQRSDILEALDDERLRKRTLDDRLSVSRSTIDRAVRRLESAGLVASHGDGYELTPGGKLALERYKTYIDELSDVLRAGDLLERVSCTCPIPSDIVLGSSITISSERAPYRSLAEVNKVIREAEEFHALLPALVDSRHVQLTADKVVHGNTAIEVVIPADLLSTMSAEFTAEAATIAGANQASIYAGETPGYGLLLSSVGDDRRMTLVVCDKGGIHGLIKNDSEGAVEWADETFDRYRSLAEEVSDQLVERLGEAPLD